MKKVRVFIVLAVAAAIFFIAYGYSEKVRYKRELANIWDKIIVEDYGDYIYDTYSLERNYKLTTQQTQDLEKVRYFITACKAYEKEDIDEAGILLKLSEGITILSDEYGAYYDEMSAKITKACDERIERFKADGVPYVGMQESEMSSTVLGEPICVLRDYPNGSYPEGDYNYYSYAKNGAYIYEALCGNGYVIETWDLRDNPKSFMPSKSSSFSSGSSSGKTSSESSSKSSSGSASSGSSSGKSKSSSTKKYSDSYDNVNIEDYYEDNYDEWDEDELYDDYEDNWEDWD